VSERRSLVELAGRRGISVSRGCVLAGVSGRWLGYARRRRDDDVLERLMELARDHPRYGCRRLWAMLRRGGRLVNLKRVRRLCRVHGLLLRQKRRRDPSWDTNGVWTEISSPLDQFMRACIGDLTPFLARPS
jgi:putative transposase